MTELAPSCQYCRLSSSSLRMNLAGGIGRSRNLDTRASFGMVLGNGEKKALVGSLIDARLGAESEKLSRSFTEPSSGGRSWVRSCFGGINRMLAICLIPWGLSFQCFPRPLHSWRVAMPWFEEILAFVFFFSFMGMWVTRAATTVLRKQLFISDLSQVPLGLPNWDPVIFELFYIDFWPMNSSWVMSQVTLTFEPVNKSGT